MRFVRSGGSLLIQLAGKYFVSVSTSIVACGLVEDGVNGHCFRGVDVDRDCDTKPRR